MKIININKLLLICLIIFMFGCSSKKDEDFILNDGYHKQPSQVRIDNWNKLVGKWCGSQETKDGGTYSWIMQMNINGMYRLEGKISGKDSKEITKIEVGEWGVGESVYFSIYKGFVENGVVISSDPSNPYNRDIYKIVKLSNDEFDYVHIDTGEFYTSKKVSSDFVMP